MKHTQSVSDLKAMAREYMLGKYGTAIVLAITLNAISIFIGIACEFTIDTERGWDASAPTERHLSIPCLSCAYRNLPQHLF